MLYRVSKNHWGEGFLYLRGTTYWIQYYLNGKRFRESAKTNDERKARRLLRAKLVHEEGPVSKITAGKLLDDLLEFYRHNRKSADWCAIVVTHLKKHFEYTRAAALGTEHIRAYTAARRAEGIENATINRELALLRRAFNLGAEHDPPLVTRVPKISKLTEAPPRAGFFESPDFSRLIAELPEEIGHVATFAYWTGCRKAEILGLQWPQVDLANRMVRLEITKGGEQRDIPLSGELLALLTRLKQQRDAEWPWCPWVFSRQGKQIRFFYTAWRSACERAKLGNDAKLLHDLRRTGVRNLIRAGVPEKVAMLISGHKTRSVFDRYHIVQTEDLREAMDRLEKHLKNGNHQKGGK